MKNISFLLVFLLLLQSCNAYHPPTTLEAAVVADKKAKVITTQNQKLIFKRLENRNNKLTGVTKLGSTTAQKLLGKPANIDGKYMVVDLSDVDIEEIRLRNESGSISLTAITIVGALLLAAVITFIIGFSNSDISIGSGSN